MEKLISLEKSDRYVGRVRFSDEFVDIGKENISAMAFTTGGGTLIQLAEEPEKIVDISNPESLSKHHAPK